MAEEGSAAKEVASSTPSEPAGPKPMMFYAVILLNILFMIGLASLIFMGKKKEAAEPTIQDVIKGEKETHEKEHESEEHYIGTLVPMETFLVNLSGSRGRKILKVNMELEIEEKELLEEIEKRKPQIRDLIIILLSSKTFQNVSTPEGKEALRDEIRDKVNAFLIRGQIKRVLFTDFIFG